VLPQSIVIVGAGIVGSHCAIQLRDRFPDAAITIVDKDPYSYEGASSGNMGGFATSEVQPLATAGNLVRGIGWMTNPLAPFTLRPKYLRELSPWLSVFVKSALTPGHYAHVVSAQQSLMDRAHSAHIFALGDSPLKDLISNNGAIVIYKKSKRMRSDWDRRWRLFREHGEACEMLTEDNLKDRLPGLHPDLKHAIHVPEIRYWTSPTRLLAGIHAMIRDRQVVIKTADVCSVGHQDGRPNRLMLGDGQEFGFDKLVVAAGAWSKSLCRDVGDYVPLDTERGYSTTVKNSNTSISNLLLFPDDDFVATPMNEGLRLGGTVELASLDAPPNHARTDILARRIKDYFPDCDTSDRDSWMGCRPSSPDGLPIIGPSSNAENVFYAFGHGHVGITQSAITGLLVAQIINGERPDVDVAPFLIQRFA
jgi:D-amino-acid dehydrogenase